ncbi:MAG: hypothetical protein KDC26_10395 [Armatimonadetes bacterium]|nr:hypothetical protein [Armatimonadota bacterium]
MSFRRSLLIALGVCAGLAHADTPKILDKNFSFAPYDGSVPTPLDLLGFDIGDRHIRSHEIAEYWKKLEGPRSKFFSYGRTHEGRELVGAVVSSPQNLKNLEKIVSANFGVYSNNGQVSDDELKDRPLIVWMGYGVHGNEASGPDAAVLVHYILNASNSAEIRKILDKTVIYILPNYNPDGRDRFANYVNGARGANATTDSSDREHSEPWPGGRTNHYWFDLNRDWLPLTQPETVGRHQIWTSLRPQITLDFHEQGGTGTYFFQPGIQTRVNPNTPRNNQEWTIKISKFHADALEKFGQPYFTEERYDDFYIGKGSTYPDVAGSIGILFEQGSTRSLRAMAGDREVTYAMTVRNQVATTFSSLLAGYENRLDLLKYQRDFYKEKSPQAQEVVKFNLPKNDPRVDVMLELVQTHKLGGWMNFSGSEAVFALPKRNSSWRLINAMFDDRQQFDDDQFYDISAWSLDKAFGTRKYISNAQTDTNWNNGFVEIDKVIIKRPADIRPKIDDPVAFVLRAGQGDWYKGLAALAKTGVEMNIVNADRAPSAMRGDYFVALIGTKAEREAQAKKLLDATDGCQLNRSLLTASDHTVKSFGGAATNRVNNPKVAVIAGSGSDSNNAGETWFVLDKVWNMEVSVIEGDSISANSLAKYNRLIMAGGRLSASATAAVREWVSGGGTLITMSGATSWLSGTDIWKMDTKNYRPNLNGLPYDQIGPERVRHSVPGTILKMKLDQSHPLAMNLPAEMEVFMENSIWITAPGEPGTTIGKFTDNPVTAGYMSQPVRDLAKGSSAFLARRVGRGKVIALAMNPTFRAFWYGTFPLLGNSIFYADTF